MGGDLGAAYVNKIKFKSLSAFFKCECLTPVILGRRKSALGEAVSCELGVFSFSIHSFPQCFGGPRSEELI